ILASGDRGELWCMRLRYGPKVQRGSRRFVLAVGPRFRAQNKAFKGVESAGSNSAALTAGHLGRNKWAEKEYGGGTSHENGILACGRSCACFGSTRGGRGHD